MGSKAMTSMRELFPESEHLIPIIEKMSCTHWRRYFLVVNAFDCGEKKKQELWGFTRDPELIDKYGHNEECIRFSFFEERGLYIVDIVSGAYFTFFITNDGIYGIGENENGQLGVGNNLNQNDFVKIESLNGLNIKKLVCGTFFSMVLTQDSEVYGFGLNHWGQLGLGYKSESVLLPTKLEMFGKGKIELETIYCGEHNVFFLTTPSASTNYLKQLYACGYMEFGQLTEQYWEKYDYVDGVITEECWERVYKVEPVLIDFFSKSKEKTVKNMISSYGFSMIITQDGCLYTFGTQRDGELGIDAKNDEVYPITEIQWKGDEIRSMTCGTDNTHFLTNNGSIYNTGHHYVMSLVKQKLKQQLVYNNIPTLVFKFDQISRDDRILMSSSTEIY
ncbi:predicted protein [Naegleria gruberi]|uniref:Predicted protein n=1 Tax=Naegleria gruberi TaxID=5762 RepID=D2VZ58_NAEGR|nr:uncharacterized protein NAEGRDRAFT_59650 [Naegleria gruberi]EFC37935.1 predicted protein [Naegleria gruberi]|eukprot:XP_002670679.1 predicted protein [Naegleria gruberi strain NEG-M]